MTLVKNGMVDCFQGDHCDGGFVIEERSGSTSDTTRARRDWQPRIRAGVSGWEIIKRKAGQSDKISRVGE